MFGFGIEWTADTAAQYVSMQQTWEKRIKGPGFPRIADNPSTRVMAKTYAKAVTKALVDLWAETVLGHPWDQAVTVSTAEGHLAQIHKKRIQMLDEETAKELEKELAGEDYRIDKILKHQDDVDGVRQYKVRFVGFGPKDDLWYDEGDLRETAPEMVDAYEERLPAKQRLAVQVQRPKGGKQQKRGGGEPKRRSSVGSGRV